MWLLYLLILVASTTALNEDPYRLPKTVSPESYAVTITVKENFATEGVFTGSVTINLNIIQNVQNITLHARFLQINESRIVLTCGDNRNIFQSLTNETDYHKIYVKADSLISAGSSCTLKFEEFEGELQDDMNGFYRSWYENENGTIE